MDQSEFTFKNTLLNNKKSSELINELLLPPTYVF